MNYKKQIIASKKKLTKISFLGSSLLALLLFTSMSIVDKTSITLQSSAFLTSITTAIILSTLICFLIVWNDKRRKYNSQIETLEKQHRKYLKTQQVHYKEFINELELSLENYVVKLEDKSITVKRENCYVYLKEQSIPAYMEWDDDTENILNVKIYLPLNTIHGIGADKLEL